MLFELGGVKCNDEEAEEEFARLWMLTTSGLKMSIDQYMSILKKMIAIMNYCTNWRTEINNVELTPCILYELMENPLFRYQKLDLKGLAIYLDECANIDGQMLCSEITKKKLSLYGINLDENTITTVKVIDRKDPNSDVSPEIFKEL